MFDVNLVIKGRGRIINQDFKETETIRNVLEKLKFKFNSDGVYLNNKRVIAPNLDIPMVELDQFQRWHKNTVRLYD